jgi:hypothetical protein
MKRKSKATHFNASLELLVRFLLLACLFTISYQVFFKWFSFEAVNVTNYFFAFCAFLLFPLNIWLEWKRFQWSVDQHEIPRSDQYHAFFQGILVSFFTPAFIATTFGRFGIKDRMRNLQWMGAGVLTGLAQFTVTMCFAFGGSLYLFGVNRLFVTFAFFGAGALSLIGYFFKFKFPSRLMRWKLIRDFQALPPSPNKGQIFMLSIIRYAVFSAQFHLILAGFGVFFSVHQVFILMLSYGLITLSPSILFGKIVIRELIAVAVFSWFDYPKEEIMLTAFFTWGFNVVLPVIFALIRISRTWKVRFFS